MKILNFGNFQEKICEILAAVLHIGNIKFEKFEKDNDEAVKLINPDGI